MHLGLMAWRTAGPAPTVPRSPSGVRRPGTGGVRMELLINLSDPKGIALFVGPYAVAVPPSMASWAKLAILTGGLSIEIVWCGPAIPYLSSPPARMAYGCFDRWIERCISTLLVAFGLRLVTEKVW